MKKVNYRAFIVFILFILLLGMQDVVKSNSHNSILIDDFEKYQNNLFNTWLLRTSSIEEAAKIYTIKTDKNKNSFLSAKSLGTSIQIAKKVNWDLRSYPFLTWKWRAIQLPTGANEAARGRNDSGAAIYVIFQRAKIPFLSWKYQPINVIKYVWSTTLPKGTVVNKDKTKLGSTIYEGRFLVLQSGKESLKKWITEKRNVLLDYKRLFGGTPEYNPYLIAILTDSNDTRSIAIADYDDIIIQK